MVGSVCRSDVHSDNLVQNNYIDPKVNCANFEELENNLKEALVELSSGQLTFRRRNFLLNFSTPCI